MLHYFLQSSIIKFCFTAYIQLYVGLQELPVVHASSQVTKLISMDELMRSATVRQGAEKDGRSPTLPTSISSKRHWCIHFHGITFLIQIDDSAHCTRCVVLRQKRREEREHKPSKAEVTFRPNESIIPSPEVKFVVLTQFCAIVMWSRLKTAVVSLFYLQPINESVNEKPTNADDITPGQDAAIPLG